jgi:hypothetical protein
VEINEVINIYLPGFEYLPQALKDSFIETQLYGQILEQQEKYKNSWYWYEESWHKDQRTTLLKSNRNTHRSWANKIKCCISKKKQAHVEYMRDQFSGILNLDWSLDPGSVEKYQDLMLPYEDWSDKKVSVYKQALKTQLKKHTITTPAWKYDIEPNSFFSASLSYLFTNAANTDVGVFSRKLLDAHGFSTFGGFASQGGDLLACLDLFNYIRNREQIAETKQIFSTLMVPLRPLYNEYKAISQYEKNSLMIVLRALLPMIVIGLAVAGFCFLLSPLGLPELVGVLILVPLVYLGAALASALLVSRNFLYENLKSAFYGGRYNTPEFQVNQRMKGALGGAVAAGLVRDFYVYLMKSCDAKAAEFDSRSMRLTTDEIKEKMENLVKRMTLRLEWIDISRNDEYGTDKIAALVSRRIYLEADPAYKAIQKEGEEYINQITAQLPGNDYSPLFFRHHYLESRYHRHMQPARDKLNWLAVLSEDLKNLQDTRQANGQAHRQALYPPLRKF